MCSGYPRLFARIVKKYELGRKYRSIFGGTMWIIKSSEFIVRGNRLLRMYSYYSLFLALLMMTIDDIDKKNVIFGQQAPYLFLVLASIYIFAASIFAAIASRNPDPQAATSYVFLEVAILAGMMYASGGLETGFSSLLLVPLVISNLLAPGVLGYGVAAWASIAIFYSQHIWPDNFAPQQIVNTGVFGALCFALAWLTQALSGRLQSALSLASDRAKHIRRLQGFSQRALMNMPGGIIACDPSGQILFHNPQAYAWFGIVDNTLLPASLTDIKDSKRIDVNGEQLLVTRVNIPDSQQDYLLFIEDSARIEAEAQQIKLASLGRLTASIAHEIRNPLSALRQASQLLAETPYLKSEEQHLTQIIEQHCMRINRTIEDILQLARGHQANVEVLRLKPWLVHFHDQLKHLEPAPDYSLTIECADDILVPFDADHLQQILHNLAVNGLRYARKQNHGNAQLQLRVSTNNTRVFLDVLDNGFGVAASIRKNLFEPFNTGEHNGTGLGLYLCRELCQANQSRIEYIQQSQGACFRITMRKA
jgi:two-component system sensor histidine kinase PilS (NtrC family)